MLTTTYAGHSDVGCKRSRNDDRWGADAAQGLYMVADGVGSSSHGDRAAQLAVELLPTYVARHLAGADLSDAQAAARLGSAVAELCEDLYARSRSTDSGLVGSDTTLVAAVITDSRAVIAHLGDSRAYLYRDRRVQQLTRDHTVVQAVVDAGELSAEEAAHHPNRSVLTRHVLMTPPARPDVGALDLQPGDRILLCSDGLHGVVDDATLAAILTDHPDLTDACLALTAAANEAGGPDNITAVLVDADHVPLPPPPGPGPTLLDDAAPTAPAPTAQQQPVDPNLVTTQQRFVDWPPVPPTPPAGHVPPQIGTPPPTRPEPRRRRHSRAVKLGLVVAIVVLLAAAAITGYLLWPRPRTSQPPTQTPTRQPAPSSAQTTPPAPPPVSTALPFTGLNRPWGVAVDTAGDLYVADRFNNRVVELAAGSSTQTVLSFTDLSAPWGVAVDSAGTVYVADNGNNRVLKLAARSSTQSMLSFTGLNGPTGVAVDSAGTVYVSDNGNHRVLKLTAGSSTPTVLPFTGLDDANGVAVDGAGTVYVVDYSNKVLELAAASSSQTELPLSGLRTPLGEAVDTAGNLYVTDPGQSRVVKLAAGSSTLAVLPFTGLNDPTGVAVDSAGDVYVADGETNRVVKLPAG